MDTLGLTAADQRKLSDPRRKTPGRDDQGAGTTLSSKGQILLCGVGRCFIDLYLPGRFGQLVERDRPFQQCVAVVVQGRAKPIPGRGSLQHIIMLGQLRTRGAAVLLSRCPDGFISAGASLRSRTGPAKPALPRMHAEPLAPSTARAAVRVRPAPGRRRLQ